MKCPTCQTFNRAEAKFCEECAAPLARTCADCGHQLSPSAEFCPECASPTGAARKQKIGSSDQSTFGFAGHLYAPLYGILPNLRPPDDCRWLLPDMKCFAKKFALERLDDAYRGRETTSKTN